MKVKALVNIQSKKGTISAGTEFTISGASFDLLRDKMEIVTDAPGESIATTCQITGDTCLIRYTPDLYQQHRHRDGEQITIGGVSVKLHIEEITV